MRPQTITSPSPTHATLHRFCLAANRAAFAELGYRNSCILTSAALRDALEMEGIAAFLLRVTATGFGTGPYPVSLGSDGDGTRLPPALPGEWRGHLVVIAANAFLLDPTLDQIEGLKPITLDASAAFLRGEASILERDGRPVRYRAHPGRGGWKSKPDFRISRRRGLTAAIVQHVRDSQP